ncbi:MAG: metallophosphoesterase [Sneathiella sp.]
MLGRFSIKKRIRVELPDNQRVIAIGDIHGQLNRLEKLMTYVDAYRERNPIAHEEFVFLGDFTDRGPFSAQVVNYLIQRKSKAEQEGRTETFLQGNHEELLIDTCIGNGDRTGPWLRNGGKQTLESYSKIYDFPLPGRNGSDDAIEQLRAKFPKNHMDFYKSLSPMHQVGPLVFVHAGLDMDATLTEQRPENIFWIRGPFLNWQGPLKDFLVVHGHSITANFKPEILPHRIGIDTGSYRRSGKITAAIFEKNSVRFFSSGTLKKFGAGPFS